MPNRSAIHPTVIVVSVRKRVVRATFAASPLGRVQLARLQLAPIQLLREDPLGLRLLLLGAFLAVMFGAQPLAHLRQQFPPKGRLPQAPAAPRALERLLFRHRAPRLQRPLQLPTTRRTVPQDAILAPQPPHPRHPIGPGRFDHQMKMIGHEHVGMDLPAALDARLARSFHQALPIRLVLEDRLTRSSRFMT